MAEPTTREVSDAELHEAVMESLGSHGKYSEWAPDMSLAIDQWILREFQAWARSKKTAFQLLSVYIADYWEKNYRANYTVRFLYDGAVDPVVDEKKVFINIVVRVGCGSSAAPSLLVLEFILPDTDKGPKTIYNNFGIVLRSKDQVKITAGGNPHCGR
jgi:hypothetical protein